MIFNIILRSQPRFHDLFSTINCYKSNSIPTQYLRVFHNFPTGPLILNTDFILKIQQEGQLGAPLYFKSHYEFQRIEEECRDTLIFTTRDLPFSLLYLNVYTCLFETDNEIFEMAYRFKIGFIPGKYFLIDKHNNFGININVLNEGQEHIQKIDKYLPPVWKDILLLKQNYNDICIVTSYNPSVFFKAYYINGKPQGFIIRILAEYNENGYLLKPFVYTAFECNAREFDQNYSVSLVDEQSENASLYLSVHSILYKNNESIIHKAYFVPKNGKRIKVDESIDLPVEIKRVYYITPKTTSYKFNDDNRRYLYFSRRGFLYYGVNVTNVYVLRKVNRRKYSRLIIKRANNSSLDEL